MFVQQTQQGHQSTITVEIEVGRNVITDPKHTHTANPTFFFTEIHEKASTPQQPAIQNYSKVEKCKESRNRNRSRR